MRSPDTQLPQPRVLVPPSLHPRLLDEVLGHGLALLGVNVPDAAWTLFAPHWQTMNLRRIDIVLDDRLLRPDGPRPAVADADGGLNAALHAAANQFVLVKPDRYVAAVMASDEVPPVGAHLRELAT